MALTCPICHMLFNSISLLEKHRMHFCVGASTEQSMIHRWDRPPSPQYTAPSPHVDREDESPPTNHEREYRQRQLQQQADQHGRQLAQYKSKSKSLEMQKDEIDRRLRQLEDRPLPTSQIRTDSLNLQQLRDQEERNQRALRDLRSHVQDMSVGRPYSSNKSFLAEIIALRQMYLRQGGNHGNILAQIADLEAEAHRIEQDDKRASKKREKKYSNLNEQMAGIETENTRLQQDLIDMQERNNNILANRANGYMDEREADGLRRKHDTYRQRLDDLENEIELLRRQAKLSSLKKELDSQKQPHVSYDKNAEVPALLQPNYNPGYMEMDNLSYGPYDPNAGFLVFYDFIIGLDPSIQAARLVVSLYNNVAQYGQPSVLPTVHVEGSTGYDTHRPGVHGSAIVRAKQPVPRCPPAHDLSLVAELQVATPGGHLSTRAWCKLDLFDSASRLVGGRFRIPFRILPIRPSCSAVEFNSLPPYGVAELFLRIANHRDADTQSMVTVNQQNAPSYQYPPQVHSYPHHYVPPPPSVTPPDSPGSQTSKSRHSTHSSRQQQYDTESHNIGFQVDRVKHANPGEGKVRITAYYRSDSHIVQAGNSPVTASTNTVQSNFKYKYHVFGRQEAMFNGVELRTDIILVIRFYLHRQLNDGYDDHSVGLRQEDGAPEDQDLVAWATMPLMSPRDKGYHSHNIEDYKINVGTHRLRLYETPVPEVNALHADAHKHSKRYKRASVRLHIFVDKPQPGSLTPSDESDMDDDSCPPYAWIPHERPEHPTDLFSSTDGFDLYIDSCRNLPDCVTFTRVAGRLLSREYERVGKDLNTNVRIDSDIYNPIYDYRVEVREPNIPPTTTLLLKVYTIDKFYKKLTVAGYAILNLFVEPGTNKQPLSDTPGLQKCLNEGCHQLRLYQSGPNGIETLTNNYMLHNGIRYVPCATILVRLYKAVRGPQDTILRAEQVPESDWVKLGLFRRRPKYEDQVYDSLSCKPTHGERQVFQSHVQRTKISLKESLEIILEPDEMRAIRTDKEVDEYIRNQLTRMMDVVPVDIDLTFISQYRPKSGIKFTVDKAMNLPWSNFTHAHFCMNPPGAFYQGLPYGAYDKLTFTQTLDQNSTNKSPAWKDGFTHFPYRSYHKYLTMIIHLQEVQVIVSSNSYKYGLLEQAWTALPLFTLGYAHSNTYQLPLFHGSPSPSLLKLLAQEPVDDWMKMAVSRHNLKLIDGASVFVRVADGRRDDELPISVPEGVNINIDTSLLPEGRLPAYNSEQDGRSLYRLVPQGKETNEFFTGLATKFKSLVYKLYEDGNMTLR